MTKLPNSPKLTKLRKGKAEERSRLVKIANAPGADPSTPLRSAQDDGLSIKSKKSAHALSHSDTSLILRQAQDDGKGDSSDGRRPPLQKTNSAIAKVARLLKKKERENSPPEIRSFAEFLERHAQVKSGSGYVPYHFAGREALREIVARLDLILASGEPDVSLAICGGAQFGKTVLLLNLLAYLVAVQFRNVGYYLPDDDLVQGLVDGKLRPDVLDQIPWLARLIAVGKTLAPSGRAVNRKGAFICTDGKRTALAFMRGLGKIPTSFSMDVVIQDEKDDLPEEHARFLSGRMTASNLRLSLLIGTQRYHGAGQNLAFTEGTQHVGLIACPGCGRRHNPETLWPGICRLEMEGLPAAEWPWLTVEGHFAFADGRRLPVAYAPGQRYVLACLECGAALDRRHPQWQAQAPEREKLRRWSYRISQLLIPDIDLAQIVAAWQLAIRDPAQMNVFCTDRLALPKSATQTLTPHDLMTARGDYKLSIGLIRLKRFEEETEKIVAGSSDNHLNHINPIQNSICFGGLDLGDQCWFVARSVEAKSPFTARLLWIEPIAAERVRTRVPELFRALGLSVLCVDAGPLRDLARDLAFMLNGLDEDAEASGNDPSRNIYFSRKGNSSDGHRPPLQWAAGREQWLNVRCAPVEFTQREGQGLRHKVARTQDGRIYPLLAAHRDESIGRVIAELLPPGDERPRLAEHADGTTSALAAPRFRLPEPTDESREVLALYERHLLAGSRQERTGDGKSLRYLDKCENHFLLATAYAALAELLAPAAPGEELVVPSFRPLPSPRARARQTRSLAG
jgi:hypothetical protein